MEELLVFEDIIAKLNNSPENKIKCFASINNLTPCSSATKETSFTQ